MRSVLVVHLQSSTHSPFAMYSVIARVQEGRDHVNADDVSKDDTAPVSSRMHLALAQLYLPCFGLVSWTKPDSCTSPVMSCSPHITIGMELTA